VAVYDARYNLSDSLACGLTNMISVSPVASYIYFMTASQTTDAMGLIQAPSSPKQCPEFYKAALSSPRADYLSYTINPVLTSNVNANTCSQEGNTIQVGAILTYPSSILNKISSQPSINQLSIWLNAGAIVGGVQFFAWFFGSLIM
jgi:hypothetical protein